MKIYPLGVGGWIPAKGRKTLSFCFEKKDSLLIIDLGTGISNFLDNKKLNNLLKKHKDIYILLSHFHLDHILGLSYLSGVFPDNNLHIFGPGEIFNKTTMLYLSNFFDSPFLPSDLEDNNNIKSINEIQLGKQQIGDFTVEAELQEHTPVESIGFKLDDKIAFITDTHCSSKTVDFVKNSQLLFHECWDLEETDSKTHSHLPGVYKIAKKAEIEKTALIHLNPALSNQEYLEKIKELTDPDLIVLAKEKELFAF